MALARKCDICGKLYEPYERCYGNSEGMNGLALVKLNERQGFDRITEVVDACPECLWSVLDHIHTLKGIPTEKLL